MPETFFYPSGIPNFPRSYMKGFVGSSGMINMVVSGQFLDFDYLSSFVHCHWKMNSFFYPATSNTYSLDYIFDGPASQTFVGGVLTPGNSAIVFHAMTTQAAWRIQLLATLPVDESQFADLAPMGSGYWNKIPTP